MTPLDPSHPVLVAGAEVENRAKDAEPISMMVGACRDVLERVPPTLRSTVAGIRVVGGIWPYADPGRLIAQHLDLGPVETGLTALGGNSTYDLVNETAQSIMDGELSTVLICGAETMRTRRADKAAGRRSTYLDEEDDATPDLRFGDPSDMHDQADADAMVYFPRHFYALVESALRHRAGESVAAHHVRISELWASAAAVAQHNPSAWITSGPTPNDIARVSSDNRMVAAPYTKLMTANINVDQGAAILLTSYGAAREAGLGDDQLVFLASGSGAGDHRVIRSRQTLDRSPALDAAFERTLSLSGIGLDDIDHLDLYSCFPAAVQLAQHHLGVREQRPFTITGGLTFAGGPLNGYCTQTIAHATELLRGTSERALLHGNGGFFTKQSVVLLSGEPPSRPFRYERVQEIADSAPRRPVTTPPAVGTIEAHTVVYSREGQPETGILSVLDEGGSRHWAHASDPTFVSELATSDLVGLTVSLTPGKPPTAAPKVNGI